MARKKEKPTAAQAVTGCGGGIVGCGCLLVILGVGLLVIAGVPLLAL